MVQISPQSVNPLQSTTPLQPDSPLQSPPPSFEQPPVLAAIDVGTNSIHMVVARIQPDLPAFTIIATEKATVRLGDRDPISGDLTAAAMDRATQALRRCQSLAKSLAVEQIIAVATSAVREAPNGPAFLQRVKTELDLTIHLIAGTEEARRIYLGVLSGIEFHNQPHVILDIGGGSTELILGSGHEPRSLSSTKVGAVRLSALFVKSDPISDRDYHALGNYIRGMLERPIEDLLSQLQPGEIPKMIGTSGTIEAVAMLQAYRQAYRQAHPAPPESLNGYCIQLSDVRNVIQQLRKLTHAQRAALPGLNERRAEIIVAGAMILQEAMALLQLDEITICERALREGVIVDWMLSHGLIEDRLRYQSSVRERSVLHAMRKFKVNRPYSEQVAQFALTLFDATQGSLHQLNADARGILWAAAMLHSSGQYISDSAHHKHSYYLIRNGELLGYTEADVEAIANLARYHRKSPPKKKHDNYRNLSTKWHRSLVDQLHPLLRLAVALNRRQIGAIAQLTCELDLEQRLLYLHLQPRDLQDDCALELWSIEQNKDVFEKT
ncbi:MAG: Ppx/GppA family phosphatase [Synechococcales cyanobacterium RM1_1_8]|nr:Ppx/GppA family phosphatase [Synechococcales cyanobacterium RM1_1_8]